ncbi:hypothetical protein NE237_028787 [Protea cynaroides]|uniref:Uncharacterized protein n=1 Tax=Protea cynaroides TaxID=273540 RepID=A0A9Q0GT30_9MAGN|nr:hypothetical protein NE237_028787 [Protea cynaroides]
MVDIETIDAMEPIALAMGLSSSSSSSSSSGTSSSSSSSKRRGCATLEAILALPKDGNLSSIWGPPIRMGEYLSMGGDLSNMRWIPLMGLLLKAKTRDEVAYHLDWAMKEDDTAMGDTRVVRELMKGCMLKRDRKLVLGLPTPIVISGLDTLMSGIAKDHCETDLKLHKVVKEKDEARLQINAREKEVERLKKSIDEERAARVDTEKISKGRVIMLKALIVTS